MRVQVFAHQPISHSGISNARLNRHRRPRAIQTDIDKADDQFLESAARAYKASGNNPKDEDDIVANIMGAKDANALTQVQNKYKRKIKAQIAKKAAELDAREGDGAEEYEFGVQLYERGRYSDAESVLQTALDMAGTYSRLGGDIQIQLALAHNATGNEAKCVELLKALEQHPARAIAKQAGELRFILEAPKLSLSEEEKVKVPRVDASENKSRRKSAGRRPRASTGKTASAADEKSFEVEFWENYSPPAYVKNKYFWVAASIIGAAAAYYSYLYKDCVPPV